jgi:DNA (cytosine-5)-methyltransferase 1
MKYFSVFSGVGGFEQGISAALPSSTCIGFSEYDKHAAAVLKYRFPNVPQYGDITKIDWSTVPDFDLLVGGSPCQDLSIAGKRAGLAGARSGLFGEYCRALIEKKPAHFIWENVKGSLSSNGGRDFAAILLAFSEAGYSLQWQVLNAKDFGVPQNRERVFVIGTRGNGGREVFFERGTEREDTLQTITPSGTPDSQRVYDTDGLSKTLSANGGGEGAKTGLIVDRDTARTIRTGGKASPHGSKQNWDSHVVNGRIRRLTPIECERLMSWSDDWTRHGKYEEAYKEYDRFSKMRVESYRTVTKEISDTQRYKMCGNGVVSKVVEEIVKAHLI